MAQFVYQAQPSAQIRAEIAMYQWVRIWNAPRVIDWVGWRTEFNKEVEYMRLTFNANRQPSRPYHGLKLDGVHLGRHIERCEHIRSEKKPVIQANLPQPTSVGRSALYESLLQPSIFREGSMQVPRTLATTISTICVLRRTARCRRESTAYR